MQWATHSRRPGRSNQSPRRSWERQARALFDIYPHVHVAEGVPVGKSRHVDRHVDHHVEEGHAFSFRHHVLEMVSQGPGFVVFFSQKIFVSQHLM